MKQNRGYIWILVILGVAVIASLFFMFSAERSEEVFLYYYEAENVECGREGLVPVRRVVERGGEMIEDTVRLLLEGVLTEEERAAGVTTEYPLPGLALAQSELVDGVLTLTFSDPQFQTSGGACRASVLWFQIERTALQFPEVEEVRFMPEDVFQP